MVSLMEWIWWFESSNVLSMLRYLVSRDMKTDRAAYANADW